MLEVRETVNSAKRYDFEVDILVFSIRDAGPNHLDVIYTTTLARLLDVTHEKKASVE